MKKLVVTVYIKKETVEGSGKIHVIDLDSGRIEKTRSFILPDVYDGHPGPKGVLRGYRGFACLDGKLYVANWDSILIFDKNLNLFGKFTHPYLADIHEVKIIDNDLYVVSTFAEAILKLRIDGDCQISGCDIFWEGGLKLNPRVDYRFMNQPAENGFHHYNNILKHSNGDFYVLASRDNVLMNITKNRKIRFDSSIMSPHDLTELENRIVMSNTNGNQIVSFNPDGTDLKVEYNDVRVKVNHGNDKIGDSYGFLLGLCIDERHFYIGTSPATVKVVSRVGHDLVKSIKISDDVEEGVHEVKILDGF